MTNAIQLSILLAAFTGNIKFDYNYRVEPALEPATNFYIDQATFLINNKMIEHYQVSRVDEYYYKITEKGQAYLKHIFELQFPVAVTEWRMP